MSEGAAAAEPAVERSRPWWERVLLELELGDLNRDSLHPNSDGARPRSARDWVVDGALFGYAVTAAGATAFDQRTDISAWMLVLNCVLGGMAALSLWTRKRHPLGVAWFAVVLSAVSSAAIHTAEVAIFSAAIHARPRRAVQATMGAIAATAINCVIYTPNHGHDAFSSNFFAFWTANTIVALALGSFIRVRRELVISLQERAQRVRSEQRLRVREAQLAERTRIAREMHDVLAHRISLLSVHAGALEFNPDPTREELVQGLSVIRTSARAAQEELREVLGVLRTDPKCDSVDPPQPTITDLERLIIESRRAGMQLTVDQALADQTTPLVTGRTVYRVVQEGLTNIRKHASTDAVSISISGRPGAPLEVRVINRPSNGSRSPGSHASEHVGSGSGLVGLTERVALAGGTLKYGPRHDGGFELTASIPWSPTESSETSHP